MATIEKYDMRDKVMVSSFDPVALKHFRRSSKGSIPIALIYDIDEKLPKVAQKGFFRHYVKCNLLKPGVKVAPEEIGRLPYIFSVWCVDTKEEAVYYQQRGARVIITNRADIIREALR